MYEILKNALSVAIGFVLGQFFYEELLNIMMHRPAPLSDEE